MSEKQVNDELPETNEEENNQEESNELKEFEGEENFSGDDDSLPYDDDEDFVIDQEGLSDKDRSNAQLLNLRIPKSLYNRLKLMAGDEGVSLEDLAFELISEGSVVRAWEIVEKKSTLRGGGNQQGNQNNNNNNFRHRQNRNGGGGQRRGNNNNRRGGGPNIHRLMEDKASFLEYVRNQEKKNNR